MSSNATTSEKDSDSQYSLMGMATQLGINVAISVGVILLFNILRPNNSLVYAPKYKYSNKAKQPPTIGTGFFAWFGPILHTPDEVLIEKIGYDATLFIRFLRMVRRILYVMTAIGICIIIPINIVATSKTGEWPPEPGVQFLSISSINYYDGDFHKNGDLNWYWVHTAGTWLFSLVIYISLWRFYKEYVRFRQSYFESEDYQRSMHARTLMIFNVPTSMRSDEALAKWVNGMGLKYPAQQICIGRQNTELASYVEEHEFAVRKLEMLLSTYLKDGQVIQGRRPTITLGGRMGCGGEKVDAIDYYSERVQTLSAKIEQSRTNMNSSKPTSYGWISYEKVAWAHCNAKHLASSVSPLLALPKRLHDGPSPRVELAPQPKDIIWSNLSLNEHIRRTKRLFASVLFYAFVFLWFIPSSFLSASSNVRNMVKLFPNSTQFMKDNPNFINLLSSWFTPIVMAIFFFILPKALRFLSQQQGYLTGTSLDRQVLSKLFIFFIINNLFVFTISSTFISMYTKISKAMAAGTTITAHLFFKTMASNLSQVTQKLCDVSTYWVNYVSLKGLGVIIDLAQIIALVTITLRKLFTRPSPRQLQEFTRPSAFDFPLFYNVLLFFFTVGLIYSVIAPLVLPFTLLYFLLATMVFKYLLMYVFITGVETGGQIWRVLFNRVLVSSTIFQLVMIGVLNMKSARIPSLALAPLPIITVIFKIVCNRRFDPHVYYYTPKMEGPASYPSDYKDGSYGHADKGKNNIGIRFGDPAFFAELPVPMVHEKVRHLLPKLYGTGKSIKKPFVSRMTRQKSVRHLSVVQLHNNGAGELQFQSVGDKDLELDDSTEGTKGMYKFNDDDESMNVVDAPNTSYYSNSFSSNQSHGNGFGAGVLRRLSNRVASPFTHHRTGTNGSNDIYAPNRPLVASTPEEQDSYDVSPYYDQSPGPVNRQMTQDMEYFVAGRSYRTHDPSTLDSSNVIEMANIYREQQAHNPIDQGYHYKTPVGAYIGNRLKHHPTNERSQQNHDYAHSNVSNAGPEWQ